MQQLQEQIQETLGNEIRSPRSSRESVPCIQVRGLRIKNPTTNYKYHSYFKPLHHKTMIIKTELLLHQG